MAARPAARVGGLTAHGVITGAGVAKVTIHGMPAWVIAIPSTCPVHGPEVVALGSDNVTFGGLFAAREGDILQGAGPPNTILPMGEPGPVRLGSPRVGLARPEVRRQFCQLHCALKADWPTLTPEERRDRYEELLGTMFATFGAPPPGVDESAAPNAAGSWSSTEWQVNLPQGAWNADQPPSSATTIHEMRHAEQTFMALRYKGGVADKARCPESVREAAAAQPIDPDSPEGEFGAVHAANELDQEGSDRRSAIIWEMGDAYEAAGPDSARYRAAVRAYRDQPGGADAYAVETQGDCGC